MCKLLKYRKCVLQWCSSACLAIPFVACYAQTVDFSGYTWQIRNSTGGPGPNTFSANNVVLDATGLHLKLAHSGTQWTTAEVYLSESLGFGTYQWKIQGRPDQLDNNVVLGLFNYPPPAVGPDGTNEIDIEFATWGGQQSQHGNWTLWPAVLQAGINDTTYAYDATLSGDTSTHRFIWLPQDIRFQSLNGYTDADVGEFQSWSFAPPDYLQRILQQPLPVHMNLWLFQGLPPVNGLDVDMVREFKFTPDCIFADGFDGVSSGCRYN